MREFHTDFKINFVDTNDVLVGFDDSQDCCESFGWFYSETLPTNTLPISQKQEKPTDLESYVFDPQFFQQLCEDDTAIALFKLIHGEKVLYLGLYNSHEGYYSHGFQIQVAGK